MKKNNKPPKRASNKTEQINVRWEPEDVLAIREIAEREDRSASSVVRFMVRWGVAHYNRVGSIQALELTSVVESINKMTNALRKASEAKVESVPEAANGEEVRSGAVEAALASAQPNLVSTDYASTVEDLAAMQSPTVQESLARISQSLGVIGGLLVDQRGDSLLAAINDALLDIAEYGPGKIPKGHYDFRHPVKNEGADES